ncbi:dentin sialophosphoprotein-like [Ischnura elegans]|uniref:dentin sialophosphoprotein-like n=1 Tax=Ischnura elegans TaxID=197161 RepID=UPI001ED89237|nr:dentin sialophosphoprotein-like [Ischnura elegans]
MAFIKAAILIVVFLQIINALPVEFEKTEKKCHCTCTGDKEDSSYYLNKEDILKILENAGLLSPKVAEGPSKDSSILTPSTQDSKTEDEPKNAQQSSSSNSEGNTDPSEEKTQLPSEAKDNNSDNAEEEEEEEKEEEEPQEEKNSDALESLIKMFTELSDEEPKEEKEVVETGKPLVPSSSIPETLGFSAEDQPKEASVTGGKESKLDGTSDDNDDETILNELDEEEEEGTIEEDDEVTFEDESPASETTGSELLKISALMTDDQFPGDVIIDDSDLEEDDVLEDESKIIVNNTETDGDKIPDDINSKQETTKGNDMEPKQTEGQLSAEEAPSHNLDQTDTQKELLKTSKLETTPQIPSEPLTVANTDLTYEEKPSLGSMVTGISSLSIESLQDGKITDSGTPDSILGLQSDHDEDIITADDEDGWIPNNDDTLSTTQSFPSQFSDIPESSSSDAWNYLQKDFQPVNSGEPNDPSEQTLVIDTDSIQALNEGEKNAPKSEEKETVLTEKSPALGDSTTSGKVNTIDASGSPNTQDPTYEPEELTEELIMKALEEPEKGSGGIKVPVDDSDDQENEKELQEEFENLNKSVENSSTDTSTQDTLGSSNTPDATHEPEELTEELIMAALEEPEKDSDGIKVPVDDSDGQENEKELQEKFEILNKSSDNSSTDTSTQDTLGSSNTPDATHEPEELTEELIMDALEKPEKGNDGIKVSADDSDDQENEKEFQEEFEILNKSSENSSKDTSTDDKTTSDKPVEAKETTGGSGEGPDSPTTKPDNESTIPEAHHEVPSPDTSHVLPSPDIHHELPSPETHPHFPSIQPPYGLPSGENIFDESQTTQQGSDYPRGLESSWASGSPGVITEPADDTSDCTCAEGVTQDGSGASAGDWQTSKTNYEEDCDDEYYPQSFNHEKDEYNPRQLEYGWTTGKDLSKSDWQTEHSSSNGYQGHISGAKEYVPGWLQNFWYPRSSISGFIQNHRDTDFNPYSLGSYPGVSGSYIDTSGPNIGGVSSDGYSTVVSSPGVIKNQYDSVLNRENGQYSSDPYQIQRNSEYNIGGEYAPDVPGYYPTYSQSPNHFIGSYIPQSSDVFSSPVSGYPFGYGQFPYNNVPYANPIESYPHYAGKDFGAPTSENIPAIGLGPESSNFQELCSRPWNPFLYSTFGAPRTLLYSPHI